MNTNQLDQKRKPEELLEIMKIGISRISIFEGKFIDEDHEELKFQPTTFREAIENICKSGVEEGAYKERDRIKNAFKVVNDLQSLGRNSIDVMHSKDN